MLRAAARRLAAIGFAHRFDGAVYGCTAQAELGREDAQKTPPPLLVQGQISAAERGRPRARRDLSTPPLKAIPHLLAKMMCILVEQIGIGGEVCSEDAGGGIRNLLPGAAEVAQGAIEKIGFFRGLHWTS